MKHYEGVTMKHSKKTKPAKVDLSLIEKLQESMNDNIKPEFKERKDNGKKGSNKNKNKKEKSSNRSS